MTAIRKLSSSQFPTERDSSLVDRLTESDYVDPLGMTNCELLKLGVIVRLQVQQASLKQGSGATRYYDPTPIVSVAALRIEPQGVVGLTDGGEIVDVHHAAHPASKNRGVNGVSLNFTGHYAAMSARFGPHLTPGIAGETILIEAPGQYGETDLGPELLVHTRAGAQVRLTALCVAAPCEPFSRFALDLDSHAPPEMTKDALRFLHHGMRGFYTTYSGKHSGNNSGNNDGNNSSGNSNEPAVIRVGDELFAAQTG